MTRAKTTGLVYDKYGTPWNYIEDVDKKQDEKYESLLENLIELSGRVTDILTHVESQDKRIAVLEKRKPARKTGVKNEVKNETA